MKSDMHAWHWLLGSALHNGEWCLLSWYWCCRVLTATPVAPASTETYNVVHIDASKVSFILVGLNKVFLYGHLCRAVFGIVSSVCRSVAFRSIIPKWNVLEMSNLVTLVNWQCVFWTEREDDTSRLNFLINMTWFYFTAWHSLRTTNAQVLVSEVFKLYTRNLFFSRHTSRTPVLK